MSAELVPRLLAATKSRNDASAMEFLDNENRIDQASMDEFAEGESICEAML